MIQSASQSSSLAQTAPHCVPYRAPIQTDGDSCRRRPLYIFAYVVKILILLFIVSGILSLIYPFFNTAFRHQTSPVLSEQALNQAIIRHNTKWHNFVTQNLSDVIQKGDRWHGVFVQPTGPVRFSLDILHESFNTRTHSTLFTGNFYNAYFNLTISGDYMPAEQGYLVMYYTAVNSNSDPGGHLSLSTWRADAYISLLNQSQLQFKGHMQPTTTFGPFVMHLDNESSEIAYKAGELQREGFYMGGGYPLEGVDSVSEEDQMLQFRRGHREIVGVLIGISIPVLLVLLALLAIITNHFRKLCCSSDSSIAFQKFQNPWNDMEGHLSASSSFYETSSYMTRSTSATGAVMSRSCTLQDTCLGEEGNPDADNLEVQLQPNRIQIRQNQYVQVMELQPMKSSASSANHKQSDESNTETLELHALPRMNTNEKLKVLFSDDVTEIPRTPVINPPITAEQE